MQFYFFQSVVIERKHFKLGFQEVSAEVQKHPHFMRYVECGWISDRAPAKGVPVLQYRASADAVAYAKAFHARLKEARGEVVPEQAPEEANEPEEEGKPKRGKRKAAEA